MGKKVGLAEQGGEGGDEPWPGLAMSRCLGHTGVVKLGIIPTPDVMSFDFTSRDRLLIIASDGIWDFIDDEEAVQICKDHKPDADAACKVLVETANQRWVEDDPTYRDDISCVVIYTPIASDIASMGISHETIQYTSDSSVALAAAKKEAEAVKAVPAAGGAEGGACNTGCGSVPTDMPTEPSSASASGMHPDILATAAMAKGPPQKDNKMIKASREQRRRSVVTKFG